MEFFTFSETKRPRRLSEETRQFAHDSLACRWGKDTDAAYAAALDGIADFDALSPTAQYDCAIRAIVEQSRIRICPGEKLSGAATYGAAIRHAVPATRDGKIVFASISHLTIDLETVLRIGIDGIEAEILERQQDATLTARQAEFLASARSCIDSLRIWHARYLEALRDRAEYAENYRNLRRVPMQPPRTFAEALQCIWFIFAFTRLCGNWPGIGRIDAMLGPYLERDLERGVISEAEAREYLAHFCIKGCEWINGAGGGSGDAQHYQNLLLAGVDEDGHEVTNTVTYLVLDVLEELNIGDFPTTVRLNSHTDEKLLRRVAEVMQHGGGVLAVYNEEEILRSLVKHGYNERVARRFANDGCWEIQIPGETHFNYIPFDGLTLLLRDTLRLHEEKAAHFDSFDALKAQYFSVLDSMIEKILINTTTYIRDRQNLPPALPCTVVSLFERGCIKRAASYLEGGPNYRVISPHLGGAADIGNSLAVIDRLCFREKRIAFDAFMGILQKNWDGEEALRQYVLNRIPMYGCDNDGADAYTVEVVDRFAELVLRRKTETYALFVPGISTFGRQIEWRYNRPASPHGHRTGDILAPNMGATPGSDRDGATALIRSYCKLNLENQVTGAALDLKLHPSALRGEDGVTALASLLRAFVTLGGCFLQPDVIDASILRDAQTHPERHTSLSVRVSGWNARFVTLSREWQEMCIEKTEHGTL